MEIARLDGAIPVLTPISSSSAGLSATHGDPRLPNLKRRMPEKQKNNSEDE
jgi:hypothetical protein